MTIYCGVDFHARQQTICYCDSAGGEIRLAELDHERDYVGGLYSVFAGDVVVGIEAGSYSTWFVELIEGLGHRVLTSDTAEIRRLAKRGQKNDRRDAGLILDLLLRGESGRLEKMGAINRSF
jgi:transposase